MKFHKFKEIINNFFKILTFVETKNRFKFAVLQIHIFFSTILETLSIFSVIPILQSFSNSSDSKILNVLENYFGPKFLNPINLVIVFFLILILSNAYQIIIKKRIIDFSYTLVLDLQQKVFQQVINRKYEFFINKDIAFFNNLILHEVQRLKSGFIESSLFILSQTLLVMLTFIGLIIYDFTITIFIISSLFTFYLFYILLIGSKIYSASRLNSNFKKNTIQYLNDIFSVIKTLVFKKNKSKFYEKLENLLSQNYKINAFEQIIRSVLKSLFEIYFMIIVIVLIYFKQSSIQINDLLSYGIFIFAAYKIVPSLHVLYSHFISFLGSSNSLKIITEELTNLNQYSKIFKNDLKINKFELQNISFSYSNNKNVLRNINYKLPENKTIGICGKSGSGKTTFIDLVSGLIDPTSGNLLINGKADKINSSLQLSNSAYCAQKTILIDDTIKNNICLETDNNNINKELLSKSIEVAELNDFIKSFENGINTIIGEDGVRVSGGEAQRINIARTIYANRKFIFFDESLNNLDMITSKKILDNLKKMECEKTIFFITHDLRLLYNFEEILIFDDGILVDSGSFSKLKEHSKIFSELLDKEL